MEGETNNEEKNSNVIPTFEWSNRCQHIYYFIAYLMNYGVLSSLFLQEDQTVSIGIPFLVVNILFVGPALFLQTTVGQYTRKSCLFLGEAFPALYGLGYSMLLLSFYDLVIQLFYFKLFFYYLLMAIFNNEKPWMECFSTYYKMFPGCISKKDIQSCISLKTFFPSPTPCFVPRTRNLSAEIFKDLVILRRLKTPSEKDSEWFTPELLPRILLQGCIGISLYAFLIVGANRRMKYFTPCLRVGLIVCLLLLTSVIIAMFIPLESLEGFYWLARELRRTKYTSIKIWKFTLTRTVQSLKLSEGGHILFGSFIPASNPDSFRSVFLTATYVLLAAGASILFLFLPSLFESLIRNKMADIVEETVENNVLVILPTVLGLLPSTRFFSAMYFFVLFLLNYFSTVVKVMVIERSITVNFFIPQFFAHFRFVICTLASILATFLLNNAVLEGVKSLSQINEVCCLAILILQQFIFCFYGYDTISDDIQFTMRTKVSLFIKISWILTPVIFCFTFYYEMMDINFNEYPLAKGLFLTTLSTPITLCFIWKMFQFIKKKNLIGIIKYTERWGPPDLEKRILRILYNPRFAVKYRRREEFCTHDCLLNCDALKTALEEEIHQFKNFEKELQQKSEGDQEEIQKISQLFEEHKQNFLKLYTKEFLTDAKGKTKT